MNKKDYIEFGVLELYVLGTLPESKLKEIEELIQQNPELKKEVEEIEYTMIKYAQIHKRKPSSMLLSKIEKSIDQEPKEKKSSRLISNPILVLFMLLSMSLNVFFYCALEENPNTGFSDKKKNSSLTDQENNITFPSNKETLED